MTIVSVPMPNMARTIATADGVKSNNGRLQSGGNVRSCKCL